MELGGFKDLPDTNWRLVSSRHVSSRLACSPVLSDENELFSMYIILPAALGPGVYSASNRNEYHKQKNYVSGEQSSACA
jgi:hypothetical protein